MVQLVFRSMSVFALSLVAAETVDINATITGMPETVTYADATTVTCPVVEHSFPLDHTLYHVCRNHGLDAMICSVNEAATLLVAILLGAGLFFIICAYCQYDSFWATSKTNREYTSVSAHQVSHVNPVTFVPRFDVIYPNHKDETGVFIHAHLGHLITKDNDLRNAKLAINSQYQFWITLARVLGLWNLTVPAVSIVLQGILKVSGDTEADQEYDLEGCARSFRQCAVAIYTVVAIFLQSMNKIFAPEQRAGIFAEKLETVKAKHSEFQKALMAVGSGKHDGADEEAGE